MVILHNCNLKLLNDSQPKNKIPLTSYPYLLSFFSKPSIFAHPKKFIHGIITNYLSLYMMHKEKPANSNVCVNVNCPFQNALLMHKNCISYESVMGYEKCL